MTVDDIPTEPDAREPEQQGATASFPLARGRGRGYARDAVDDFVERARVAFEEATSAEGDTPTLTAVDIRHVAFPLVRHGYAVAQVDAAMARIEDAFAVAERARAVRDGGAAEWVDRTRDMAQEALNRLTRSRGRRFSRVSAMRFGYRIDEVDLVADRIAAYLERGDPVTAEQVRAAAFRMQRGGYREAQVDALLDAVVEVILAVR